MGPHAAVSTLDIHALLGGAKGRHCLHKLALLRLDRKGLDLELWLDQCSETLELRSELKFDLAELLHREWHSERHRERLVNWNHLTIMNI